MVTHIRIGERSIGEDAPCFVIAEAGVNHNGDPALALKLIDAAADAGTDAVKFQTFKADRVATGDAPKANYQNQTTDASESQLAMLKRLELGAGAYRELAAYCRKRGVLFLSTPFEEESSDFLESLEVPAFKIPSGEITNLAFLTHVARKKRPMIVSTGMSTLAEVEAAVAAIRAVGNQDIVLLHCVSNYPAAAADVNLRAMTTMAEAFSVPVGYSDHTTGTEIALAAAALGACVIEKHFTLDRNLPGPDHKASLEPDGLAAMVRSIRNVEVALGHGRKEPAASERNTLEVARKSLVAACDIPAGTKLTADLIACKRPGTGLSATLRDSLVGRTTVTAIRANTLFTREMIS